jgi:topoisomerase IV subunit A
VLDGYLIAYLNLDEVIRIIREEDEPKPVLMARFKLTDVQAEAILNMRLRAAQARGMEIKGEHEGADQGERQLEALLGSETSSGRRSPDQIKEVRKTFGPETPLGKRRTDLRRGAGSHDRRRSPRRWSSASRSPSSSPRRAGSGR